MKKYRYILFIGLIALIAVACKQNDLDDLKPIQNTDRNVSGAGANTGDAITGNEIVKVPFKISLSGPATKAFQVGIAFNNDTVTKLIANGTLKNTVVLPAGAIDYPGVINVAFGSDTATAVASVRLSAIEANYGKNIAFAFKLTNPGKGNQIKGSQSNILVVLDTKKLIKESDIHYVSLLNGGGIMDVDYQKNYTTSPAGITIPLTVNLAGVPAGAFNVHVKLNMDTIADLVSKKILPDNTIALNPDQFSIDTLIRVKSNASTGVVRLSIGWPVFDANIVANKRFGFVVSLVNPSKHILHPTKSKLIVLVQPEVNLDNNSYITGNGTGLKAEYFSNNQLLDFDGRKPDLVQIEPTIDWPKDEVWQAAIPGISHDNFSTRWTGEFLAPVRGEYVFWQNEWDDGSRLYIDGKAIINDFTTKWDQDSRTAKIFLERGKRYKIEADHRENVGGQRARLTFEVPSAGINGRRIVPQSQLFPAP
ncbi:PA14 domain-containing protein [Mucilaginibacter sp. R-33]|uniref:PA14 domain-containing protein n=1 Tax=unclassified Mucilaginibacter TaxID=2617802 RepID=UPI003CF7512C